MPKGAAWKFTETELAWLKKNCKLVIGEYTTEFNEKFGHAFTKDQLRSFRKRNGWSTGRTGRFEKGNKSWNKGTKGLTTANKTTFKKGNRPSNAVPVGTEVRESKDNYIKVKVAEPNEWKFKHKMVWESAHGPIPKGYNIIFLDSDRENCALENLAIVSKAEQLALNRAKYKEFPEELKPSVLAVTKLEVKQSEIMRSE